ncbi:MAG: hypothetical protein VX498_12535 [Myxococcota bacterium]|nr:hypothetical protein [Myxococcota bacterium]
MYRNAVHLPRGLLALLLALPLLGGCCLPSLVGSSEFSKRQPYALKFREFRSILHAQQLQERLDGMGLDPYLIAAGTNEESGRWFQVVTGSEKDLADIRELRHEIEEEHGIEDIEVIDYTSFGDNLVVNPSSREFAQPRTKGNRPAIPEVLWETMELFPVSNFFYIERMTILTTPSDPETHQRHRGSYGAVKMDLPRGIKKKHLREVCSSVSEVIFRDNLYGDQVTINILRMRTNHGIYGDITDHFADLVLDTGSYRTEEKVPFKVKAGDKLTGYKVTIEPKANYLRTYIILMDPSEEWVYFSQSTDKTPEEMVSVLKGIGKSDGMLEYTEFYNTVHTVPDRIMSEDLFVGFTLRRLGWSYARNKGNKTWAKAYVGHWAAKGLFHHEEKGSWTYGVYDLLSKDKVRWTDANYSSSNPGLGSVDIYGTKGKAVTTKRWSKRKWRYYQMTTEVNWNRDRYVVMVDNTKHSWLGRQDLINRGNSLQLNRPGAFSWRERGDDEGE